MDCLFCRKGMMTKEEVNNYGSFLRGCGSFFLVCGSLSALYGVLVLLGGNPPAGWEGISPVLFLSSGFTCIVVGAFLNAGHLVWACGNCGASVARRHVTRPARIETASEREPQMTLGAKRF